MSVVVEAPAKLTLSLRIVGVRPDGYHLIDAEMVALELADVLTIDAHDGATTRLSSSGPFAPGVPLDERNLVARALRWCGRSADVHLRKLIPHGGGLGGGSADAAAALRWAGVTGDTVDLAAVAQLGADVPFCLVGGRARVGGIGEVVEPLPFEPLDVTLVVPPLAVSTPAVYRAWDDLDGASAGHRHGDGPNDLEAAAIAVEPALARWRDRIREAAGRPPVLAGSGATWFVHGHHPDLAEALSGATVVATRTRPAGPA